MCGGGGGHVLLPPSSHTDLFQSSDVKIYIPGVLFQNFVYEDANKNIPLAKQSSIGCSTKLSVACIDRDKLESISILVYIRKTPQ